MEESPAFVEGDTFALGSYNGMMFVLNASQALAAVLDEITPNAAPGRKTAHLAWYLDTRIRLCNAVSHHMLQT